MAVGFSNTNKPLNPRGQDASPKGYNRAKLYSGKALDFDGVNDNVGITSATDLWTGDFSVSWYGNLDATGNYFAFSSGTYTGSGQAGINVWYGGASNTNFSAHFPESDGTGQQGYNLTLAESYEYWHRIDLVFVSSSRLLSLYQNGILVDTATIASNVDAAYMPNGWEFGRSYGGSFPLNGKLTNLKAFNTALTAAQVADLYNNPEKVVPTGLESNLKLWLPMMEGAGTTAYDGSGNGNHGTISGATYVNGIGAPSPQSAVMDWNKGTNRSEYSEDLSQSAWAKTNISVSASATTAPDGSTNAWNAVPDTSNNIHLVQDGGYSVSSGNYYVASGWFKANGYDYALISYSGYGTWGGSNGAEVKFDLVNGTAAPTLGAPHDYGIIEYPNGWYRCYTIGLANTTFSTNVNFFASDDGTSGTFVGDGTSGVLMWGLHSFISSEIGPYIPTLSTAQTSPVLLPQGLTTGRDITGVNLFENVRKQGALNLDGNSWAEVHDNASVDLTTGATLECWYKWGTQLNAGLLGRWDYPNNQRSLLILHGALDNARLLFSFDGTNAAAVEGTSTPADGTWVHIAGTYDGTTFRLYVNATQEATASSTGVLFNSPDSVEIGRHGYGALDETNGSIAQPRIYNRALTASEVLQNYNSGKNTYK